MARAMLQQFNNTIVSTPSAAAWVANMKPFSDMFKSILTQTTDTGQVNWATVAAPVAGNATRDFEVYQFTDSLQSTSPMFLRIDYIQTGSGSSTIQMSVGTSTDGAGTLTSLAFGRVGVSANYTSANWYVSTDGSQVVFFGGADPASTAANNWYCYVVERFRNADGTPSGDGYNVWYVQANTFQGNIARVVGAASQPQSDVNPPVMLPQTVSAISYYANNTEYAFPFITGAPVWRGASQAFLFALIADFPRLAPVNVTHYGKTAQFISLGNAASLYLPYMNTTTTAAARQAYTALLRWE